MARAGSHPGRRRGPLSGVDLPPERWPLSAARDPLQTCRRVFGGLRPCIVGTSDVFNENGTLVSTGLAAGPADIYMPRRAPSTTSSSWPRGGVCPKRSMRVHFKKTPSVVEVPFSTSFRLPEGVEASAAMSGGL
jgi:hypothetical protein